MKQDRYSSCGGEAQLGEGGMEGGATEEKGALELKIVWEKKGSLEGWDAGTDRPVFTPHMTTV